VSICKYLRERDYGESLKSLNLWTLEERRNRQDFMEVFKTYKGFTWLSIDKLFESDEILKELGAYFKIANKTVLGR